MFVYKCGHVCYTVCMWRSNIMGISPHFPPHLLFLFLFYTRAFLPACRQKPEKGFGLPETGVKESLATMWVLETDPGFSARKSSS